MTQRRNPPYVAKVYANSANGSRYWQAAWYNHAGKRERASVGNAADLSRERALVEAQKLATQAAVAAVAAATPKEPEPAFRTGGWFKDATRGALNPDRLRAAWVAGRIAGRKNGSTLQYNVESVLAAYADFATSIRAALTEESGATPGKAGQNGPKSADTNLYS